MNFFKDIYKLRPLLDKQDKWRIIFLLGLMFLSSLLEAASLGLIPVFVTIIMRPSTLGNYPWVGQWFIDLPNEPTLDILIFASITLFSFIALKNCFLCLVYFIQSRFTTSLNIKLSDRMFKVYQSAPYEWYVQRSSSQLLRNIQHDIIQILTGVITPLLNLIMALIILCVILIVMLINSPESALLGLIITICGIFIVIRIFQKYLKHAGEVARQEYEQVVKAIQQGFGAFVDARIIGCEQHLNQVHRDSLTRLAKTQRIQATIQKSTPHAIETFTILGLLATFILLFHSADNYSEILPIVSLLAVAMIRFKQLGSQVSGAINSINTARAYIPDIVNDFNELNAIKRNHRSNKLAIEHLKSFKIMKLNSISYQYPNTDNNVLTDISLTIKKGESIGFVGETGCGKSTLVNILLGLLEPQTGSVLVNGFDIYENLETWQNNLTYIPQSIYFLDDTIRANVAFGTPPENANENQVWQALCIANLESFVKSLPKSLDTIVGERGVLLSGGQRQRLGIARSLYFNKGIIVMDEGTSALDNKTEDEIMRAIRNIKQDRTLILIAHRLSTIKQCDRLYFIKDGQIKSTGTFDKLIESCPDFRQLARQ